MPVGQPARRPTGNIPATLTSFIGRAGLVAATRERMELSRLVTLVGPGGVGKTRLALEVGREAAPAFEDGAWFVDLASLTDATRLRQSVLAALQARDQSPRSPHDRLADHVRDRQMLIVLDNCEHLLEPCARMVTELLRGAPRVRVLATSREGLGIAGEHLLVVPPLDVPDPACPDGDLAHLASVEAVMLFAERARAVQPTFAVGAENAAAVARLCAMLDGLPLAVELAAVRMRSLSVEEIVSRLDDRFALLVGGDRAAEPRQQTLRALIDWSHDLCSPLEQALWARLSTFAGSFDLAAAEAVCSDARLARADVLNVLDQLVAKSIILSEPVGTRVRHRMLVSVRDYAAQRLGEEDRMSLRRRHRDHFLERARAMSAGWSGPGQSVALMRMREDLPNLRAALQWSLATPGEAATAARLASELRWLWVVGGLLSEGRRWLDQALDLTDAAATERVQALWVAGWVSLVQGDAEVGAARLGESSQAAARAGDVTAAAHCLQWQGVQVLFASDPAGATRLLERAVAAHGLSGNGSGGLFALFQLAVARAYADDLTGAQRTCDEGMRRSAASGDRWARAYHHWAAAVVAARRGDSATVTEQGRKALEIERDFEDGICAALVLELLAHAAAADREHLFAAQLLGAAQAVWAGIGTTVAAFGPMGEDHLRCEQQLRSALGEAKFAAARGRTSGLTIERAIAFGLGEQATAVVRTAPDASPLSRREGEVAALIAQGASNKAIADQLVLSVRTVEGHVERILGKLGFSSRSQVAAWVVKREAPASHSPVGT